MKPLFLREDEAGVLLDLLKGKKVSEGMRRFLLSYVSILAGGEEPMMEEAARRAGILGGESGMSQGVLASRVGADFDVTVVEEGPTEVGGEVRYVTRVYGHKVDPSGGRTPCALMAFTAEEEGEDVDMLRVFLGC